MPKNDCAEASSVKVMAAQTAKARDLIFPLFPFPDEEDVEQVEDTENGVLEDVDAR